MLSSVCLCLNPEYLHTLCLCLFVLYSINVSVELPEILIIVRNAICQTISQHKILDYIYRYRYMIEILAVIKIMYLEGS